MHMTEKPKEVGPLLLDIDFRQKCHKRLYKFKHLDKLIDGINDIIQEHLDVDTDDLNAYVFEKKEPAFQDKQDSFKDGIYLIPIHVHVDARFGIFRDIKNRLANIFDEAVINKNGWMMYGSKKHKGKE